MISIKKITGMALATLSVLGLSFAMQSTNTYAKGKDTIPENYSFDYSKLDSAPIPYYSISKTKNAYMWNYSHTKRIHNLKNYPNTIWMVTNANVRKVNGKKAVYYKVYSAYNPKVKGLVYAKYLRKNIAISPELFNSQTAFMEYINHDKSQVIARNLAKLFPNSKVSLELSKQMVPSEYQSPHFYDPTPLGIRYDTLKPTSTPTQVVNMVKQQLDKKGYTAEKRTSMKDYSIGLNIVDNAQYIESNQTLKVLNSSIYPGTFAPKYYDENSTFILAISIAKNK